MYILCSIVSTNCVVHGKSISEPAKNSSKHQKFLMATLPVNQCYFCGQNGVPIMIMIEMETAIAFTDKPIRVKGILRLTNDNATYQPPVSIVNAKLIN